MNYFNNIVNNYGYKLIQEANGAAPQGQPADPNNIQQDPNQQQDPNAQGDDINGLDNDNIDPNPTVNDQDFNDTDVMARIHAIRSITKVSSILDKISLLKEFIPKFDVQRFRIITKNVIDNIDIFATEDLITFRELILSKMNPNLKKFKFTLKESEALEKFLSDDEKNFIYNFEAILEDYEFFTNNKSDIKYIEIKNNDDKESVLNDIRACLYKLKREIDSDVSSERVIANYDYKNRECKMIINDAIALFELIRNKYTIRFKLDENDRIYYYDVNEDEYEIENLHIINEPICEFAYPYESLQLSSGTIGHQQYELTINRLVDYKDILLFALDLRKGISIHVPRGKQPYDKECDLYYYYLIQAIIKNSFNYDISIDIIKKYKVALDNNVELDSQDYGYIAAAHKYYMSIQQTYIKDKLVDKFLFKCLYDALTKFKIDNIPVPLNIVLHKNTFILHFVYNLVHFINGYNGLVRLSELIDFK